MSARSALPSSPLTHRPLSTATAGASSQQQPERLCDTIPVPQNLVLSRLVHALDEPLLYSPSVSETSSRPQMGTTTYQNASQSHPMDIDIASTQLIPDPLDPKLLTARALAAPRKLCVRHQRMADEGTTNKMQQVCPFPSISFDFPSSYSPSSLPLAHSRASMPSHSRNAKPSTASGPLSPLPPIPVVNSSSAASLPWPASPSFPSSPRSSKISSASILSSSYLPRYLWRSSITSTPCLWPARPRSPVNGTPLRKMTCFGEIFANSTSTKNAGNAVGVFLC